MITYKEIQKAKKNTLYQYTKIEYKDDEPIEIVEFFDRKKCYIDKVVRHYNQYGIPVYKKVEDVRKSIKKLTDFEYNKPVIIIGRYYKVTIIRESRNIVVRNSGGKLLKYFDRDSSPISTDKIYIISYNDTTRMEEGYFNGWN